MLTPIQQDYLETIYHLAARTMGVRTTDIAETLGCRLPTVTRTVQRMARSGYLFHESRGLVRLTAKGRRAAESIAHRHSDIVSFLIGVLGLTDKQAQADACQIEHGLSPLAAQRLHEFLEYVEQLDVHQRAVITGFAEEASSTAEDFRHLPVGRTAGWRS